ncbi:MAG: restriction endonuclease subunit S, partial [Burkholderiaceae bacterium]
HISTEEYTEKYLHFTIEEGDLLFASSGGSWGKTAFFSDPGFKVIVNTSTVRMHPYFKVCSRFYMRAFVDSLSFTNQMLAQLVGMQPNFGSTHLSKIVLALPPLAEQHRIVAKVDELMSLCDQLETQHSNAAEAREKLVSHLLGTLTQSQSAEDFSANWQRIAAHFDTLFTTEASIDALKQILLQLAVMGKLVPQDPNDEPASELLRHIQAEKTKLIAEGKIKKSKPLPPITDEEKPFDLPHGWEWIRVSEIAELTTSGSRDWAQYLSDKGAKFVTMGNLSRGSYELRLDNMRYVNPPKDGEGSRTKLEANDLLISITGDVGNLGRIPEGFGEAYINQHTCLLRFVPQCRNRYFPEAMRSPMAALQFNAPQRGIKNSFRLGDLNEMVIPLPPLAEQYRIVAKVDELMALCDALKTRINEAQSIQIYLADTIVNQALA